MPVDFLYSNWYYFIGSCIIVQSLSPICDYQIAKDLHMEGQALANVRILHCDDSLIDGQLVEHELERRGFSAEIIFVQSEAEYHHNLVNDTFDIILSDYRMPTFDGDKALAMAKELRPEVPFIMVTGELGETRAIETLKRGATDYVLKDNLQRLVPAIERALEQSANIAKRKHAEAALLQQHFELQTIHRMTEAVSRAETLEQIYQEMFDAIEHSLLVRRASILLFENDKKMHFKAWRNLSNSYRAAVDGHSPWNIEERNPHPILVSDVLTDRDLAPFLTTITNEEIRALAFVPLMHHHRLLGKFMVYYERPHDFSEQEVQLLQTIGAHISFAIGRRQDEDRYRDVILALPAALYTTDEEGRITLYNELAAEMWGRRPETGKDLWCGSWKIFEVDGTPLPHDQCPMAVTLRTGESVRGREIMVERPDGTRKIVRPFPDPLRDPSGRLIGAVNMLVDVTEQRIAERAKLNLAAIVETSDDAIIGKSPLGTVTSWNRAAERMFEYTTEEIVGKSIMLLVPENRRAEEDMILERLQRGERIDHYESVRLAKSGREVYVSLSISPIRNMHGQVVGGSSIMRDITDRIKKDRHIRRLNEDLEGRVRERTSELELVNRELEVFAHSVSHDLRAPLRTISSYSAMLGDRYRSQLEEPGRRHLEVIIQTAAKMNNLIERLLNFSRLGSEKLQKQQVDMSAIASKVIEELKTISPARDITVRLNGLSEAHADDVLMKQVFENLLSNAFKFTGKISHPLIEIGSYASNGDMVYFVKDNGVGFDPQSTDKLFHVFQRLHREDEYEGTGIGLANVQRIVQKHGGRVWAEGNPGKGATFFFTLPRS